MNDQSNLPAMTPEKAGEIMEALLVKGDLAQLNPTERAKYYTRVCTSMGLNPLTQPLAYITLNGKLTLYALKNCTDQLRKIYSVSVLEMTEKREGDLIVVTVKVQDAAGRTDMSKGALSLGSLKGEALANAIMKAETKAKRRATLSICGLGFLDETEVETIPGAKPEPRVLKKDHRADYHTMLAELDHTLDPLQWRLKNENAERISALPPDWQTNITTVIDAKISDPTVSSGEILADAWGEKQGESLRAATQVHAPEPPPAEAPETDSAPEAGPVKQAGTLCGKQAFWRFLSTRGAPIANEDQAADYVRIACKIASRRELATDEAAGKLWRALVADYRAWQREPAVVDEAPPHRQPPADQGAALAEGAPDREPPAPAGAPKVPSAQAYFAQWTAILDGAVPSKAAQIAKAWNDQNALRGQIEWTDDHPFSILKKRVAEVLAVLKDEAS